MATRSESGWQPQWAVAPGEVLLEALEDRSLTQAQLALRLGRPVKTINEIVKGKAAITPETAIQLERALGISSRFWSNLESQYRQALARQEADLTLEREASWADKFPIADLIRYGLIERGADRASTLANLLSWLGLGGTAAFDRVTNAASYHASPAFAASPEAVSAWLRWGELQAADIEASPFDAARFRDSLREVRALTRREPFAQVVERVQAMCRTAGVVVVLTPELTGTHLSGAVRWLGSRAVIQLSLRHKTDDEFWFTFFHEAGHILAYSRRRDVVDGAGKFSPSKSAEELAADKFARDLLLPPASYEAFIAGGNFSMSSVRAFAKEQAVAPGIVAGRLERDELVARGALRSTKKSIRFAK